MSRSRSRAWTLVAAALTGTLAAAFSASCTTGRRGQNPGNTATSGVALAATDVDRILAQAVSVAEARNQPAAVAVVDREGEVLGVFVSAPIDSNGDGVLEVPGESEIVTAISKASTAAAFQSEGETFTTRTAYFIVQGHFPPGVRGAEGGPLFGVQDSGQPNSDAHVLAYDRNGNACGSGLSGLFGGVPLYLQGSPVGGIGVATVAPVVSLGTPLEATLVGPLERDVDEAIARGGAQGFEAPWPIQATQVFVGGIGFPFYGNGPGGLPTASALAAIPASTGSLDPRFPVRASGLAPEVRSGMQYGLGATHRYLGRLVAPIAPTFNGTFTNVDRPASVTFDPATLRFQGVPIVPLAQSARGGGPGEERFPPIDSVEPPSSANGLSSSEVSSILDAGAAAAHNLRAQIRRPVGSTAVVHIAVCDLRGNILGVYRMGDGTLFSFDVAVQKARTAAFFSSDGTGGIPPCAITPRAIGFLAQPFFPPGIDSNEHGVLVRLRDLGNRGKITLEDPPSNVLVAPPPRLPSDGTTDEDATAPGRQSFDDFGGSAPAELAQVRGILSVAGGIALFQDRPDVGFISPGLQSGLQTFPGGVPLYRDGRLVGGVGVSGDGVDQDDFVAFNAGAGFPPPSGSRCDEVSSTVLASVLGARIQTLVAAIVVHPDLRIRNVYEPVLGAEAQRIFTGLGAGFQGVTIPYVKLPRNPNEK